MITLAHECAPRGGNAAVLRANERKHEDTHTHKSCSNQREPHRQSTTLQCEHFPAKSYTQLLVADDAMANNAQ